MTRRFLLALGVAIMACGASYALASEGSPRDSGEAGDNGCKSKVNKADPEKQLEMVFGPKAFEKAFEVKSEKTEQKEKS